MIERLNNYIGSTGKKYRSHYHTILNWFTKDGPDLKAKTPANRFTGLNEKNYREGVNPDGSF